MRVAPALCLALAAAPAAAHADPVDPRVALLERDATHARIWYVGFTTAYAVSAVAQTTFALLIDDDGLRVDAAVGAGSSWLAVGGMVISPIPNVWRAAADARGGGSLDAAILRAATAERSARAWYNHALCGAVAVGAGLILWLGYDRPISGVINFAENLVVGEVNLLTIPTRSLGWRDRPAATWHLAPTLQGVQLVGTW
jgi:hypothetical protein